MTDIRKATASAITGHNLSTSDLVTTALDHIAALAFSDRLGSCLWRLKYAHDHTKYDTARILIAHQMDRKLSRSFCLTVAATVLDEWLYDVCPVCVGRGRIVIEGTPVAPHECPECKGTGKRVVYESERLRAVGNPKKPHPKLGQWFASAAAIIERADAKAAVDVRTQLESWGWRG